MTNKLNDFDQLPDDALTDVGVVATLYSCSKATVWRRVKSGHIPEPRRAGLGSTRWRVGDIRIALKAVQA